MSGGWHDSRRMPTSHARPELLASTEWLAENLLRPGIRVVDCRWRPDGSAAELFAAGHIEGARSIPIDELEQRLAELPADREVIAYCRGPFCAYAHEAVRTLRAGGHEARRLDGGWPEWRLASRPKPPAKAA